MSEKDLRQLSAIGRGIKVETTRKSKDLKEIRLSGEQIVELLRNSGFTVPHEANVVFRVPSGGDYSGMDIEVDSDNSTVVSWEE